jgi:hypothetical protein
LNGYRQSGAVGFMVVALSVTVMAASIGSATNVVDGLSQSISKQNA